MAQTVHLFLKANGSDIKGESTQASMGRENSIECVSYSSGVTSAREAASNLATGRRQHEPLIIRKRIDKASPLLSKALVENQQVEGVFKFYRPNPTGDGTTEQFFTVAIKGGRVFSQKLLILNTLDPQQASEPPLEEVGFVFHTINWTYTNGGIEHEDNWSGGKS
ncbi:MAG TPA: type VI secretion system tube protein TssD [Myxococcaceae bacterium]|jgi:type VI secretion system secreted protein Hcp|nr:type VI secretion system tube protein TssD [Myxococcaceae bacterium]